MGGICRVIIKGGGVSGERSVKSLSMAPMRLPRMLVNIFFFFAFCGDFIYLIVIANLYF